VGKILDLSIWWLCLTLLPSRLALAVLAFHSSGWCTYGLQEPFNKLGLGFIKNSQAPPARTVFDTFASRLRHASILCGVYLILAGRRTLQNMDRSASVYDILCNEEAWHWDTYDGHKLVFYRDGTGEVSYMFLF
jgi:hypothetical protein